MLVSLTVPLTTSSKQHCQDYSSKAHNSGELSKLIQEEPVALGSLPRIPPPAASYPHGTDVAPRWVPASTAIWPSQAQSSAGDSSVGNPNPSTQGEEHLHCYKNAAIKDTEPQLTLLLA